MDATHLREAIAEGCGLTLALAKKEIAKLQRSVDALTARQLLAFRGVWKADRSYDSGDAVTHQGGLWVCTAPTSGARPNASPHWRLAVKSGSVSE